MGSYINHSCLANAHKVFLGDMMLLRALRPMKAGEEITLSYISPLEEKRQDYLRGVWGIECQCGLCLAERSDGSKTTQTRQKTSVEFVGRNLIPDVTKASPPSNKAMQRAKALVQQVDATYDQVAYAGVPRSVRLPRCSCPCRRPRPAANIDPPRQRLQSRPGSSKLTTCVVSTPNSSKPLASSFSPWDIRMPVSMALK